MSDTFHAPTIWELVWGTVIGGFGAMLRRILKAQDEKIDSKVDQSAFDLLEKTVTGLMNRQDEHHRENVDRLDRHHSENVERLDRIYDKLIEAARESH